LTFADGFPESFSGRRSDAGARRVLISRRTVLFVPIFVARFFGRRLVPVASCAGRRRLYNPTLVTRDLFSRRRALAERVTILCTIRAGRDAEMCRKPTTENAARSPLSSPSSPRRATRHDNFTRLNNGRGIVIRAFVTFAKSRPFNYRAIVQLLLRRARTLWRKTDVPTRQRFVRFQVGVRFPTQSRP